MGSPAKEGAIAEVGLRGRRHSKHPIIDQHPENTVLAPDTSEVRSRRHQNNQGTFVIETVIKYYWPS